MSNKIDREKLIEMLLPQKDAPGGHLSDEEILDFVAGKTTEQQREEWIGHIVECRRCTDRVHAIMNVYEAMSAQFEAARQEEEATEEPLIKSFDFKKIIKSILPEKNNMLKMAVAATIVLVVAAGVYKSVDSPIRASITIAETSTIKSSIIELGRNKGQQELSDLFKALADHGFERPEGVDEINIDDKVLVALSSQNKGGLQFGTKQKLLFEVRDNVLYVKLVEPAKK